MNRKILLLIAILTLGCLGWAQTQSTPPQTPAQKGMPHGNMGEMHKQHTDAMKADVDKMKTSLDQLKANVATISDAAEKARWQANVDMWTVVVGHMEEMQKHMDAMGPGGMMGHGMHHGGMGGPPSPPPPAEPKPQ